MAFARQVAPIEIRAIDQGDLLAASPAFQLLLTENGIGRRGKVST